MEEEGEQLTFILWLYLIFIASKEHSEMDFIISSGWLDEEEIITRESKLSDEDDKGKQLKVMKAEYAAVE